MPAMTSFIPDPASWPFAPGESPFRIKGTGYRAHMAFVKSQVPGGVEAMVSRLGDVRFARFFEQAFLAASHYDICPLIMAAAPCAVAMGISPEEFVALRSRTQAPEDLNGVYRFVLAMIPTRSVAKRLPQLLSQMVDFATTEVERDVPGEVDAFVDGIPSAIAPWFATVFREYGEAALRTSGASEGSILMKRPSIVRREHGVAIVRAPIEIRWK
jgi:hypothetical protein